MHVSQKSRWWGGAAAAPSESNSDDESQFASRLIAGVLHEVNTPLGALASTAATLRGLCRRLGEDAPAAMDEDLKLLDRLSLIQEETAQRLRATMRALERFVDLDRSELRLVNVEESLQTVAAISGGPIRIERVGEPLPQVLTDARSLHRVLLHVFEHALASAGPQGIRIMVSPAQGDRLRISISDGVPALDPTVLDEMFEPRLAPVDARVQMDLDWPSTLRTVRALGGDLDADSCDEHGTTITVILPLDGGLR